MGISIEFADDAELQARIKVVGVGGGGGNAINTMIHCGLEGVEFIAANTDAQALPQQPGAATRSSSAAQLTRGLGAGAQPGDRPQGRARRRASASQEALAGADMVFVTAGMGGGTGTGAAPIIAQIARDQGALTVGVVTKPFALRRPPPHAQRERGHRGARRSSVDTIITIPNEKLLDLADDDMSMLDAFRRADDVLLQAVRGISDLIVHTGTINVDFADVKTIMSSMGRALMGTGYGRGDNRALEAAEMADQLAAARRHLGRGRDRHPDQLHRRPRPQDSSEISEAAQLRAGSGARRREHHLRLGHRPRHGRRGQGHRDRDRLRHAAGGGEHAAAQAPEPPGIADRRGDRACARPRSKCSRAAAAACRAGARASRSAS